MPNELRRRSGGCVKTLAVKESFGCLIRNDAIPRPGRASAVRMMLCASRRLPFVPIARSRACRIACARSAATTKAAKMVIGMLPGVDCPALAAMIPTKGSKLTLLLNVVANAKCKEHHMAQFAIMGNTYSRWVLGKQLDCIEYGGAAL